MFPYKSNPIPWLSHVWISYKTLRKCLSLRSPQWFHALQKPTRPGVRESRVQNEAMMPFSRLTSLKTSQNFVYFRNSGKSPQATVKVSCTSNEVQAYWEGSAHFVLGTYFDLRWDPDLLTTPSQRFGQLSNFTQGKFIPFTNTYAPYLFIVHHLIPQ